MSYTRRTNCEIGVMPRCKTTIATKYTDVHSANDAAILASAPATPKASAVVSNRLTTDQDTSAPAIADKQDFHTLPKTADTLRSMDRPAYHSAGKVKI